MYSYVAKGDGSYNVGHYAANVPVLIVESNHNNTDSAAARVHYLNGGDGPDHIRDGKMVI